MIIVGMPLFGILAQGEFHEIDEDQTASQALKPLLSERCEAIQVIRDP
jgi:hypothetical protein